ncbi:hypothetical protein INR49_001030 [Caranx melampygus]|nr:hypothetical protein INR49_001030 [Caranx melampygus]
MQAGAPKPEENPSLNIDLKIQQLAISGLKVSRLDMYGEKYKPFKGVKYVTKAGKFQGVLRTQRRVNPASVRILMEAASASLTVSFTDCIRFWALWTSISVAWLVLMRLSVHCLATSLASLVTSSEALAMSLAH